VQVLVGSLAGGATLQVTCEAYGVSAEDVLAALASQQSSQEPPDER